MDIIPILEDMITQKASDIFVITGLPISCKTNGIIKNYDEVKMKPVDTEAFVSEVYRHADRSMEKLENKGDDDFSFAITGLSRFRVNAYKQRGTIATVIRVIQFKLPEPSDLNISQEILNISKFDRGLVLVTGSAGSGKSTTLACIINEINTNKAGHIITLEDPLEYLHSHKKCIVSQREVNSDTDSFLMALRSALRQSPDVILIGELRDPETIEIAMTAAETGHLILSSLHTIGAANTIDRIVDSFPPNQQQQILLQLSMVLKAVVSQQLVPTTDGKVAPVFEIMTVTPAIRNLIREGKVHQIDNVIATSAVSEGMLSLDKNLLDLYNANTIDKQTALNYAANAEALTRRLR